jgi:hypothetical protein
VWVFFATMVVGILFGDGAVTARARRGSSTSTPAPVC